VTARSTRRGFTLFELIVVMALLVLLAAIVLPSIGAFRGDTRQRAAADAIRGELATARAHAMEKGQPFRVAISEDGARVRRAPDAPDFASVAAFDRADGSSPAVEYTFQSATVRVVASQDAPAPPAENGWVTIATVQPDGTCREDTVLLAIGDDDRAPLYLRVRGLTGASRVVPAGAAGANGGPK
jgi:type II secretion system protein H